MAKPGKVWIKLEAATMERSYVLKGADELLCAPREV